MLRFLAIVTYCLMCSTISHAGPIEDKCYKLTDNNADFRQCVSQETAVQSAPMAEQGLVKACNDTSCVYRLKYRKETEDFSGADYTVKYRSSENGREISIRDPKGRMSTWSQCGTCNFIEYEKGPLKNLDIKYDGKDALIVTIRRVP